MEAFMMIGLPASGKSTWISKTDTIWKDTIPVVCSSDAVIENIVSYYNVTYDESFADLAGFANKVFHRQLDEAIVAKSKIVIDRTNLTPEVRANFISKLKEAGYTITAVNFTVDEELHRKRLKSRPGKSIPDFVISKMKKNYTPPTLEEGFDHIVSVKYE